LPVVVAAMRSSRCGCDNDRMSDVPRGAVQRTARLATLPLGIAGRTALGVGKRLGGRPAEAVAEEIKARTAEQIFSVLGELKGGAMKVGQALSVLEAAFPEELAGPYRATLTKLQEAAPALPTEQVHAVLQRELGTDWRDLFVAFDDEPTAAASLGQVHRATWSDGSEVAVKVQYPGAADALLADLAQVSRLGRTFGSLVPGLDIKPLVAEVKERMLEELDYTLEAGNQADFAAGYAGSTDVRIPEPLAVTPRVLVSRWLPGTPLSAIIRDGSQEERDAAGQLYLRFLFTGPSVAGLLHADPHPGNYRLTDDGALGVLDFGAVNRLPDGLPPALGRLLSLALSGDSEAVQAGLAREGFIRPGVKVDAEVLMQYLGPFVEPARQETFHFSREWMRGQFARISDPRSDGYSVGFKLNLPADYLLIHRVWLGGVAVLCQLGATIPVRQEMQDWVPGFTG
jgi:predicted unusual protein kinase regulating ubiquinone biosynthesis (AarF/ABC1/UbiB family)